MSDRSHSNLAQIVTNWSQNHWLYGQAVCLGDVMLDRRLFDRHLAVFSCRYIGVTEADYEWLTDQIVQVANRCVSACLCRHQTPVT